MLNTNLMLKLALMGSSSPRQNKLCSIVLLVAGLLQTAGIQMWISIDAADASKYILENKKL